MEKQILSIQLAIFADKPISIEYEQISLWIKEKYNNTTSQIIPIPADAPSNLPRLQINLGDKLDFNVAKNRVDIYSDTYEKALSAFKKLRKILSSKLNISISRIGFVKTFFAEEKIDNLKKNLCEKFTSQNLSELSIRINKVFDCKNGTSTIKCNNIEDSKTASIIHEGQNKKGILTLRDINTITLPNTTLPFEKVEEMFKSFNDESENFNLDS